ncbi:MAG TPA: ATP-binding cassette domain-containing protein, partial [Fimbriimonadaceae bacterium]|nr:ATP-binding cassette domain-containing protein [Fimbriimonadaceae bacterium]
MVETEGLVKHFTDNKGNVVKAVDGVSFSARPGEIFGLLGCNGAGKTTTLRILSTVIKPTAGSARVAGIDVLAEPEKVRANIGFMSTSTALYGRLLAKEAIEYFGKLYGLQGAKLKERLDYVIDKLQIGEFADRLCDKLSTGQKQR